MYSRVLLYETMTKGSPKKNSKTRPPIFRRKRVSLVKITVSKLVIVMSDFFDDSGSNGGKIKKMHRPRLQTAFLFPARMSFAEIHPF